MYRRFGLLSCKFTTAKPQKSEKAQNKSRQFKSVAPLGSFCGFPVLVDTQLKLIVPNSVFDAGIPARRLYNSEDMSRAPSQHATRTEGPASIREVPEDPRLHDLVPFVARDKVFAVFADQVDGTAEAKVPVPLPNTPPAVIGVICVRGRMLTVIDPIALLTGEIFGWPASLP